MRSTFCTSCGGKNEFSYQPPKFCNHCGESFGGIPTTDKSLAKKVNPLAKRKPSVPLKEDETDIDFVPNIAKLEYEIDIPHDNIHKMSDILNEEKQRP